MRKVGLAQDYVKVVKAHKILRERMEKMKAERELFKDTIADLRIENREMRRELKASAKAAKRNVPIIIQSMSVAISRMSAAGMDDAAASLEVWRDLVADEMVPLASVPELLDLIEEWFNSSSLLTPNFDLITRTEVVLSEYGRRELLPEHSE